MVYVSGDRAPSGTDARFGRGAAMPALGVLVFMALLAAQTATGFARLVFAGGTYPRALRFLDSLLGAVIVAPFGRIGGAVLLLGLGAVMAVLVLRAGVARAGSQ